MKYIVITGGVISGLGKGITAASIGRNLIDRGYNVTAIKIDPYINVDAGIISPLQHGEIFVLKDGGEVDLDLGNYERFLDVELTSDHDITTGKIYLSVINKERNGEYLGQTVQIIPHITNEIKYNIRNTAKNSFADVCLIEVGGTVGDIESMFFLEAIRQMKQEEQNNNIKFVHVSLVFDDTQGEQKTKPTQHSVKEMRTLGLSPDFIICRSQVKLNNSTKEKISMFCDVKKEYVISAYDTPNLYEIPLLLEKENLTDYLIKDLELPQKNVKDLKWTSMIKKMNKIKNTSNIVKIIVIGKYTNIPDSYMSIFEALKHSSTFCEINIETKLINSEFFEIEENINILDKYDGVIVPGGFGIRGSFGLIRVIKYVREKNIPFLGIGLGMQLSIIEYAQNVIGIDDVNTVEFDKDTKCPVITSYINNLNDNFEDFNKVMMVGSFDINIKKNTLIHTIYNHQGNITERFRNKYIFSLDYQHMFEKHGLIFSGFKNSDVFNNEVIVSFELPKNKFFIGVQYHPEFKSRPNNSHPIFNYFLKIIKNK